MNSTRKITLLIITLFISASYFAQQKGKPSKEKIKAMKVGYITEKVNLTSEEAQKFWPIYNEFEAKMDAIHKEVRKMHKQDNSIDEMTDAEVEKLLDKHTELKTKELAIEKSYHTKFKAILPIKKVAKLYKANHDFKRDLLKKIKNHKGGNRHGTPPPRH